MQISREVVKDVQTALQLEQELQLSQAQHGVAVLDIYSSEWGNSKSLSDTFRRLYTDAGDQIHLRFFSIECNSVLESLNYPEEQRNPQRPKNIDMCRETLPDFWADILASRRGKSKPYFVFYKEGTKRTFIEGINTPKIISYVRDLCLPQKPVNECVTNNEVLKFWEAYFSPAENEVFWDSFVRAITASASVQRPLRESEEGILARAIGVKSHKVTAEALEKWIGNDQTIEGAFLDLFPSLKDDASRAPESALASESRGATPTGDGVPLSDLDKLRGVLKGVQLIKPPLWHRVTEVPLILPDATKRFVFSSPSEGQKEAIQQLQQIAELPTLQEYLNTLGVSQENVDIMCHAADESVNGDTISYGKLAFLLTLCDQAKSNELLGCPEGLRDQLADGMLFQTHPPIAFTTLCMCASDSQVSELFYNVSDTEVVKNVQSLTEGDHVVLPPFLCMGCSNEPTENTVYSVKVIGLPKVINVTASNGETISFNRWYGTFKVTEKSENSLGLTFVEHVEGDSFEQCVQSYTQRLIQDEEQLSKAVDVFVLPDRMLPPALRLSPKEPLYAGTKAESGAVGFSSAGDSVGVSGSSRANEERECDSTKGQEAVPQTETQPVEEARTEDQIEIDKDTENVRNESELQSNVGYDQEAERGSTPKQEQDNNNNKTGHEDAQNEEEAQPEVGESEEKAEQETVGEEDKKQTSEKPSSEGGLVSQHETDEVRNEEEPQPAVGESEEKVEQETVAEEEKTAVKDEVPDHHGEQDTGAVRETKEPKGGDENEFAHEIGDENQVAHEIGDENQVAHEIGDENEFAHEIGDENQVAHEIGDENQVAHEIGDENQVAHEIGDENEFAHEIGDEVAVEAKDDENDEL